MIPTLVVDSKSRHSVPEWALRPDAGPRLFAVMGIVNVTPDSFSDGGRYLDTGAAVAHGLRLAAEGADVLDIGGESTRPGAVPVDTEEELRRVIPVIRELAVATPCRISVDTRSAAVAEQALDAGAQIINDVSALRHDVRMIGVAAERNVPVVLMHMQGQPETMQTDPRYDDVVSDIRTFFEQRCAECRNAGVLRIAIDPGIGFGKRLEHNLALLARLRDLSPSDEPVVLGASRKSFLGVLTGSGVTDRLPESLGAAVTAWLAGASILRVHDVDATVRALSIAEAIVSQRAPAGREHAPARREEEHSGGEGVERSRSAGGDHPGAAEDGRR